MSARAATIAQIWLALLLALSLPACDPSSLCSGPECESFYPRGRLTLLSPAGEPGTLDAWGDALVQYDGTTTQGNGWVTAPIDGGVLLGMPESAQVLRLDISEAASDTTSGDPRAPLSTSDWSDPALSSGFGTDLLAQPAVDGSDTFDLWVSAPRHVDADGVERGAVFLFRDAAADSSALSSGADLLLLGTSDGDRFGEDLAFCSDLTGDKLPELLVSAPWLRAPDGTDLTVPALAGAIYLLPSERYSVLTGVVDAWSEAVVLWGDEPGEGAGTAIFCGDLENNGTDEIVIGSPWAQDGRGRISIIDDPVGEDMPASGALSEIARVQLRGSEAGEWFGAALAALPYGSDMLLAIGSPGYDLGLGSVSVVVGGEFGDDFVREIDGEPLSPDANIQRIATFGPLPQRPSSHFGRWLYTGDIDGDAQGDLIVGAPDYLGAEQRDYDSGRLWIWFAANRSDWTYTGYTPPEDLLVRGEQPFERIGRAISIVDLTPEDEDKTPSLWIPTSR